MHGWLLAGVPTQLECHVTVVLASVLTDRRRRGDTETPQAAVANRHTAGGVAGRWAAATALSLRRLRVLIAVRVCSAFVFLEHSAFWEASHDAH